MKADVTKIASSVSGVINKVYVRNNEYVERGQVLVALDNQPFKLAVAKAQASLSQLSYEKSVLLTKEKDQKENYLVQESKFKVSQQEFNRYSMLHQKNIISSALFDQYQNSLSSDKEALINSKSLYQNSIKQEAVLSSQIKEYQNSLSLQKYYLSNATIRAPHDGYVNNLNAYSGEYIKKGDVLFGIVAKKNWRVIANIKETNLVNIYPGKTVWVHLASAPWRFFERES
ncbi:HlyD family secretion protein [Piscirickettsia litoralis]|nr:biotin/lipoyl-binding protein [Piscirickettsia litoralis]